MSVYNLVKSVNCADTMRDPDDIHLTDLGTYDSLEKAIDAGNCYIRDYFFNKDTIMHKLEDGSFGATDFCSYGATLKTKEIEVK